MTCANFSWLGSNKALMRHSIVSDYPQRLTMVEIRKSKLDSAQAHSGLTVSFRSLKLVPANRRMSYMEKRKQTLSRWIAALTFASASAWTIPEGVI